MVKINRRIAALAGVGAVTLLATPVLAPAVPRKRGAGKELHDATNAALANTLGYATVDELKQTSAPQPSLSSIGWATKKRSLVSKPISSATATQTH